MSKAKFDQSNCLGCGACVSTCEGGAFSYNADGAVVYDPSKCKECKECACAAGCPVQAITKE